MQWIANLSDGLDSVQTGLQHGQGESLPVEKVAVTGDADGDDTAVAGLQSALPGTLAIRQASSASALLPSPNFSPVQAPHIPSMPHSTARPLGPAPRSRPSPAPSLDALSPARQPRRAARVSRSHSFLSAGPARRTRNGSVGSTTQSIDVLTLRPDPLRLPVGLLHAWTGAMREAQGQPPIDPHQGSLAVGGSSTAGGVGDTSLSLSSIPVSYEAPATMRMPKHRPRRISVLERPESLHTPVVEARRHIVPAAMNLSPTDARVYQRYLALGSDGQAAAVATLPLLCTDPTGTKATTFSASVHYGAGCVDANDLEGNCALVGMCVQLSNSRKV